MWDKHHDKRDRFQMIAVHATRADSIADYEKKIAGVVEKYWGGRELPFPVLVDASGKTARNFGLVKYPLVVLIDPAGKIVRNGSPEKLDEILSKVDKK